MGAVLARGVECAGGRRLSAERSPIAGYLDRLGAELHGVGRRRRRALLSEIEEHLQDAAAEEREHGAGVEESERLAVGRLGDPAELAAGLQTPPSRSRRLVVGGALAGFVAALAIAGVVVHTSQSSPQPVVIGVRQLTGNRVASAVFTQHPGKLQFPYSDIARLVPARLPAPLAVAHCTTHGYATIFLMSDGSSRTYRYCALPRSLRPLRRMLMNRWSQASIMMRVSAAAEAGRLRASHPVPQLTMTPPVTGGTAAQRSLIARIAATLPLPGAARISIVNGYTATPHRKPRNVIIVHTVPSQPNNPRIGWASVADDWAGQTILRAYHDQAGSSLPPLQLAMTAVGSSVYGSFDSLPLMHPPQHPMTLAALRAQAQRAARAHGLTLVRVQLADVDGPNALVEFRTADPRIASAQWEWVPPAHGLKSSLVLLDNPCGVPIAASMSTPAMGGGWFDPVWFPPGFDVIGPVNGYLRALLPKSPCY